MTKYAKQILDLVLCSTEHPAAEQIFLQMKQENSKIAQATVYNNLNALVADGKLIRLSQPGAPDRYDNTTRHDHLICTRCGALADFKFTDLTHDIEASLRAHPVLRPSHSLSLPRLPQSAGSALNFERKRRISS